MPSELEDVIDFAEAVEAPGSDGTVLRDAAFALLHFVHIDARDIEGMACFKARPGNVDLQSSIDGRHWLVDIRNGNLRLFS